MRKPRVPIADREPSKTSVFVSNLPFSTTTEALEQFVKVSRVGW